MKIYRNMLTVLICCACIIWFSQITLAHDSYPIPEKQEDSQKHVDSDSHISGDNITLEIIPYIDQGKRLELDGAPEIPPKWWDLQYIYQRSVSSSNERQKWDFKRVGNDHNLFKIHVSKDNGSGSDSLVIAPESGLNTYYGKPITVWTTNSNRSQKWTLEIIPGTNGAVAFRNDNKPNHCITKSRSHGSDQFIVQYCPLPGSPDNGGVPYSDQTFKLQTPSYSHFPAETGMLYGLPNYVTVGTGNSSWSSGMLKARNDYHNNTDLNVWINNSNARIWVVPQYLGSSYIYLGAAFIRNSSWQQCNYYDFPSDTIKVTGLCNDSDKKVHYATISINQSSSNYPAISSDDNLKGAIVKHELGHVFGMSHEFDCVRIMADASPCGLPYYNQDLRIGDIVRINSWY